MAMQSEKGREQQLLGRSKSLHDRPIFIMTLPVIMITRISVPEIAVNKSDFVLVLPDGVALRSGHFVIPLLEQRLNVLSNVNIHNHKFEFESK